jgi:UDP-N-acetyl-D-mannosaminuronate dehydrogenase
MNKKNVVVVGLGEVGKPLSKLLAMHHNVTAVDLAPVVAPEGGVDVLHICYPFEIPDFVDATAQYIARYNPALTIISSTVGVGTTRVVAERAQAAVVHSPVRGKHAQMFDEMLSYTKFVGGITPEASQSADEHFRSLGLKTRILASPEATELAKLTETTYFGVLIAWAQELERYCDRSGQNYEEIISFYEEIKYLPPVKFFPGIIGGHCVMPNIEILKRFTSSRFLDLLQYSNQEKSQREAEKNAPAAVSGTACRSGSAK